MEPLQQILTQRHAVGGIGEDVTESLEDLRAIGLEHILLHHG